jgi:hypothetical protein
VVQRYSAPTGVKNVQEPNGYMPQEGDIAVFDHTAAHRDGYIQYYDGKRWISDFKQNFYSPFHDGKTPASTIYRFPDVQVGK